MSKKSARDETTVDAPTAIPAEAAPNLPTCYICLTEGGHLVQPCDCTWLHIHRECLMRMVEATKAGRACAICKTPFRGVETTTEEVRSVNFPAALLVTTLVACAVLAGTTFLYMLILRFVGGDQSVGVALGLLGPVSLTSSAVACYANKHYHVVQVETRWRAVVVPS